MGCSRAVGWTASHRLGIRLCRGDGGSIGPPLCGDRLPLRGEWFACEP